VCSHHPPRTGRRIAVSSFEIAPAVVARVASFPLSVFSDLTEPTLAAEAKAACDGSIAWRSFEADYEAAIDTERERLWAMTAGDAHFMLALAFANPRLAGRVASLPSHAPRNKSRRQMETTLYRYLARAAGRCQPFGLWAGVSLVGWGTETRIVRSSTMTIKVEPNLQPLFSLVRALAHTASYRRLGLWRINPTLGLQPDGYWTFWARSGPEVVPRRARSSSGTDAILEKLTDCGPTSFEALLAKIEPCSASRDTACNTLAACAEGGILVGGLEPPWRFSTAREAMKEIEEDLIPGDRGAWREARLRLESICRSLQDRADVLAVGDVLVSTQKAALVLGELAQALHLPCPDLPVALLRCDLRSPIEIQLGEDVRSLIEGTLEEYLRFQGSYGFGDAIRRGLLARYLPPDAQACALSAVHGAPVSRSGAQTWEELGKALGADGDFAARISRWKELLGRTGDHERIVAGGHGSIIGPPFGWLQLGFTAPHGRMGEPAILGVHDDLWGPYARHAPFWSHGSETDALHAWILSRLSEIERDCGVEPAELVAPCEHNPNVLARPPLGIPLVSPWSCLPGALDLRGACVMRDTKRGAVLLTIPGTVKPIAVLDAASADVQSGDPIVQLLLATSLGMKPGPELHAASVMFAHEPDAARPSPEVVLPGGAIVRTRRTVLGREAVQAWLKKNPAARFAHWTQLARRHDWPRLVMVRREDGLSLPMHRDSPLALASLLAGAGPGILTVESWPAQAWIDDGGRHFVAELAVPFLRREHVLSRSAGAESASE